MYLGLSLLLTPRADPLALYFAKRPTAAELPALMEEADRDLKASPVCRRPHHGRPDPRGRRWPSRRPGLASIAICGRQPEKIPSAHRFLTYYLDTVGRILGQYVKPIQEAGLRTSEVREFQRKVRAILPKLKTGFDEQLTPADGLGAV